MKDQGEKNSSDVERITVLSLLHSSVNSILSFSLSQAPTPTLVTYIYPHSGPSSELQTHISIHLPPSWCLKALETHIEEPICDLSLNPLPGLPSSVVSSPPPIQACRSETQEPSRTCSLPSPHIAHPASSINSPSHSLFSSIDPFSFHSHCHQQSRYLYFLFELLLELCCYYTHVWSYPDPLCTLQSEKTFWKQKFDTSPPFLEPLCVYPMDLIPYHSPQDPVWSGLLQTSRPHLPQLLFHSSHFSSAAHLSVCYFFHYYYVQLAVCYSYKMM